MIHEIYIPRPELATFKSRLEEICKVLGIQTAWLLQTMYMESRLKPDIENKVFPFMKKAKKGATPELDGYATGLIQFIPQTARDLGTTTLNLKAMNRTAQLDYVLKYFLPYKDKMKSFYDVYLVVFFPAGVGQSDEWVFETKNISRSLIAKMNPAIDLNKDGKITMAEFKQYCNNGIPQSVAKEVLSISV